jgi:hypothetical protein
MPVNIGSLVGAGVFAAVAMTLVGRKNNGDDDDDEQGSDRILVSFSFAVASCMIAFIIGRVTAEIPFPKERRIILGSPEYDMKPLKAPTANGGLLNLLAKIVCSRSFGHIIRRPLINDNGLDRIRDLADQAGKKGAPVVFYPMARVANTVTDSMAATCTDAVKKGLPLSYEPGEVIGVMDYYQAYSAGKINPTEMMHRVFGAMDKLSFMNIFVSFDKDDVLQQAKASEERWAAKKPLSVFDGVPITVKGKCI